MIVRRDVSTNSNGGDVMPTISTDQAHRGSDQMMMGGGTSAPVCWNFDMFDKNENCGISLCAKRAGDTNVTMRLK